MIQAPDEILTILARDARVSMETLAQMTGRPEADVRKAVDEYEKNGVIKSYMTLIDWEKAGIEKVIAFIDVKVTPARDVGFDGIAKRIARFSEIQSVWLVSGECDLRVIVEAASVRALGQFVAEKLAPIEGVSGTITHFLLRKYKEDHVLFTDSEESQRLVITP